MSKKPIAKAAAPVSKAPAFEPGVRADHERHTCIELSRSAGLVSFIPLDILGMELKQMTEEAFDELFYRRMTDYPVERAARLYVGYATDLGGSTEALQELGRFTTLTEREIQMATAKKTASAAAKAPAEKKTAAVKAAKPVKEAKAKVAKPAKEPGERKPSAAQMFKDLIMEGKKTDDQIFAAVQKQFGLDDNKKTYVKWYRNDLIKKGETVPAAR